jgi:predicted metalloprotease
MRWDEGHESPDVIDRRGEGGGNMGGGSGLIGTVLTLLPYLVRHPLGILILLILLGGSLFFSGALNTPDSSAPRATETHGARVSGEDRERHFVSFVLDDVQNTWRDIFAKRGQTYPNAKLVLFSGETPTSCGYGVSATGPFYCPTDERVYIDLSFYDELAQRFGAKGDFAQAYVIAHEIGHHVQNQLGTAGAVRHLRRSEREGETGGNVRLELQADCLAGVWAHSTESRGILEAGDIDEALYAASAIGDDRLQKAATGTVTPETFTHGTAEQRARWFRTGYEKGDIDACDTFKATKL